MLKAVVFRSGAAENYAVWERYMSLPVISVAAIPRPRLNEARTEYTFAVEKEEMEEKMRMVLRIAAEQKHEDLCLGSFGVGPGFLNPASQVAAMWRKILFAEKEFQGVFSNIVFAIQDGEDGYSRGEANMVLDVFEQEFAPSNTVKTEHRYPDDMRREEDTGVGN